MTWSPAGDNKAPPYKRMALEALRTLPLPNILAKDAAVAIWVIDSHQDQVHELAAHWGLTISTKVFCWVKSKKDGTGFVNSGGKVTMGNPEDCFLYWRGDGLRIARKGLMKLIYEPRREHSRKPDTARQRLETMFGSDVRRIELFARERFEGWDAWGDGLPL